MGQGAAITGKLKGAIRRTHRAHGRDGAQNGVCGRRQGRRRFRDPPHPARTSTRSTSAACPKAPTSNPSISPAARRRLEARPDLRRRRRAARRSFARRRRSRRHGPQRNGDPSPARPSNSGRPAAIRRGPPNPDARGEFRFRSLPPADYRVAAWQDLDDDLAQYPPFRAAFDDDAAKAKVAEKRPRARRAEIDRTRRDRGGSGQAEVA